MREEVRDFAFQPSWEDADYLHAPLPTHRDDQIREAIESVMSPGQYVELRRRVTYEQSMLLQAFAERAATLAVRQNDERLLVSGLIALYLAGFDRDEEAELLATREAVLVIPLLFTSAKKMGVGVRPLIARVERIVGKERASTLRKFWRWAPWMRSLKAMGFRESTDPEDPLLYERIPA